MLASAGKYVALVLLVFALAACSPAADPALNSGGVDEPAQDEPVPEPTATDAKPTPEMEVAEEPALPDIDPFAEGLSGGNTDAFPFPATDDAFEIGSFGNLYSYLTYYDMDELILLYQAAMPTLGFAPTSDTVIPDMAILSFEGEGKALTLNIDTNADGTNKVTILVGTLQ